MKIKQIHNLLFKSSGNAGYIFSFLRSSEPGYQVMISHISGLRFLSVMQ